MYTTTNPELMKSEVETAQRIIDRYCVIAHLSEGQRDALAAARKTVEFYEPLVLSAAKDRGEDFVSFTIDGYSICYSLEDGRWEGFVSMNGWTEALAS